jgi:hypothetical protein
MTPYSSIAKSWEDFSILLSNTTDFFFSKFTLFLFFELKSVLKDWDARTRAQVLAQIV